ncbi:MAG: LysM peptidoglycan-binding domain-containing protein [Puniceicoccales bacterium]|jgi:LysM repeat protein|nr:LysM peptidoglycan-binding domain-containing protein [Puniceicoccales bacterium]
MVGCRLRLVALCLLLCLCGCERKAEVDDGEASDPEYLNGIQLVREGNEDAALSSFLNVISRKKNAVSSHLHVGCIYLDRCNDPIYAIYHFREYLSRAENSKEALIVKQLIDTAKKRFIGSLPGHNCELNAHVELIEIAKRLRAGNVALKRSLREAEGRCKLLESLREEGAKVSEVRENFDSKRQIRHVVRVGDTLSKISQKYYGTPTHWKKIFEANQDDIPFPSALTVGQELIIP